MRPYKFILSGGGTGGHIPAIAIANELKLRFPDAEFYLLEPKIKWKCKVPQAGYAIKGLWIADCSVKLI
jgi:UDP-N-acetylglucosamine--N-acetylmuramyl-(pentapeptide) pyrophosphoryl-undecaprenol N-acetylglucosamine transferase